MNEKKFVNAQMLSEELGVSKPFAYKLISSWNKELEKAGFCTIHGRVPRAYYEKKFFGFADVAKEV